MAVTYFNTPLFDNEEATRLFYGYSKDQWKALKDVDNGFTTTELTKATMDMARACLIPTEYGDLLLSAGTLFRGAKALSKVNFKNTGEFLAQSKTLKNQATNVTVHAEKITNKVSPKVVNNIPCFGLKGFNIQAVTKCSFLSFLRDEVINLGQNQFLKGLHQRGGIPISDVLKKSNDSKYFKNKLLVAFREKSQAQELYNALNSSLTIFKNSSVVQIRKTRNFDIYTINLNPFKIGNEVNLKNAGMTLSGKFDDFPKASKIFIQQHPELIPSNILNTLNTRGIDEAAKEFEKLRLRWGLTWHHLEDLEGLILVPGRIHSGISHWGANAVISRIASGSDYLKLLWKKMMVY